jgi:hypothetical protein
MEEVFVDDRQFLSAIMSNHMQAYFSHKQIMASSSSSEAYMQVRNPLIREYLLERLAEHPLKGKRGVFPIQQLAVHPSTSIDRRQQQASLSTSPFVAEEDQDDFDDKNNNSTDKTADVDGNENSVMPKQRRPYRKRQKLDEPQFLAPYEADCLSNIGSMNVSNSRTFGDISLPVAAMIDSSELLLLRKTSSSSMKKKTATAAAISSDDSYICDQLYQRYDREGYLLFKGLFLTEEEKQELEKLGKSVVYQDDEVVREELDDVEEEDEATGATTIGQESATTKKKKKGKRFPPHHDVNKINVSCQIVNEATSSLASVFNDLTVTHHSNSKQTRPRGFSISAHSGADLEEVQPLPPTYHYSCYSQLQHVT